MNDIKTAPSHASGRASPPLPVAAGLPMPAFESIDVQPISGACGCEISGVDLRQTLAPDVLGDIMKAFEHFAVIVFRDQDLTPEQHKAFSRYFGELMQLPQAPTYGDHHDMQEVRREAHEPENVVPSFEHFHTDSPFLLTPPKCVVMRALEVPQWGGDTAFSNAYLVYEHLSDGLKHLLDGLEVVYSGADIWAKNEKLPPEKRLRLRESHDLREEQLTNIHPAVRIHPATGRKALFFDAGLPAKRERGVAAMSAKQSWRTAIAVPVHENPVCAPAAESTFPAVYTLGFLTLISAFNYFDRSLLGLAMPQIKAEMQISDTVMGLVSGLAFVLFYSIMSVPIAWAADRSNRRNIIAAGLAFWSLMTLATGWVSNIWQLTIARFLMGAGEACGIAPSNSITADLFRAERRPLAYSIFATAASISSILFFPIAGWVGQHYGWRQMFVIAGIPGIFLAGLFLLTVREPLRGAADRSMKTPAARADTGKARMPFWQGLRSLLRSRAYLALLSGATLMGLNIFASSVWTPTFLTRVHNLSLGEIAATIGPVRGICGIAGVLIGGMLVDRLGRRAPHWRMSIPAAACICLAPAEALFALSDMQPVWLSAFAVSAFLLLIHQGPVFAGIIAIADVRIRALATSILLFCSAVFGQAIGPLFVGVMNDVLEPRFGPHSIRYSMLIIAATAVLAGLSFVLAGRYATAESDTQFKAAVS